MAEGTIRIALGDYPISEPIKKNAPENAGGQFQFEPVTPITKAFRPMIARQAYDISEMAIVTYLQARAHNKPIWLLPIVLLARFQHRCVVCNSGYSKLRPKDLEGRTIGVRAYSQTTGAWARGILANEYGVDLDKVHWLTFEDAHVAEYRDPPTATRAAEDKKLADMLLNGEIDAAIMGNDLPKDDRLVTVIEDPRGDAKAWYERTKVIPINHVVVATEDLIEQKPDIVRSFFDRISASKKSGNDSAEEGVDMNPLGVEALRTSLETIIEYSLQQGLIPRRLSVDELFHDATKDLGR